MHHYSKLPISLLLKRHMKKPIPPGQLGVGVGNRVGALAESVASFTDCVCIHLPYFLHWELLPAS